MRKNQKVVKMVLCAVLVCAVGMLFSNVAEAAPETSATWYARHINAQNAPAEANHVDHVTIMQQKSAKAICSSASHSITTAYTGEVGIVCENYGMTAATIQNIGTVQCFPNVGEPYNDVLVKYQISAYTPTNNDIYECKGSIAKNP